MEPIFSHSIELADIADLTGVDEIKIRKNNNETYSLKYKDGTFSLTEESEEGIKKLIKLKDVVFNRGLLNSEYNGMPVLFGFDSNKNHFNLEPLVFFSKSILSNGDDGDEKRTVYTISKDAKNLPPLIENTGRLFSVFEGLQFVVSPRETWYRLSIDKVNWLNWIPIYRPEPLLDLKITSKTVISHRSGRIRQIYNSGTDFVTWAPYSDGTKLDKIELDLKYNGMSKHKIGIIGGKIQLKTVFGDAYFTKVKSGIIEIEGYMKIADEITPIIPQIKFRNNVDNAFLRIIVRIDNEKLAFHSDIEKGTAQITLGAGSNGSCDLSEINLTKFMLTSFTYYN